MLVNVVLCGGSGTRLFPLSRSSKPKQFIKLNDEYSLFQKTIKRNMEIVDKTIVVANEQHYFIAIDEIEGIANFDADFVLEPEPRNTAAAVAISCFVANGDDILFVTPSDHTIAYLDKYKEAVAQAVELANEGFLVTFGIKPSYAETGFGYIESKGNDVVRFIEKPNVDNARSFLQNSNYLWNSGMFCFKAKTMLSELEQFQPQIYSAALAAVESAKNNDLIRISYKAMMEIPALSIDYAVMEQSSKIKVVASDIGWSDVGSFDSIYNELPKSEMGNTLFENYTQINSSSNLVIGSNRLIATVDIDNLIIVDTDDVLLLAQRGSSQKIKALVEKLQNDNNDIIKNGSTVFRPWGSFAVLENGHGFKIKKITVKPGKRLSLQKHIHRSEHWIVVSGIAKVTVDEKEFFVKQNESTYIEIGQVHRLENPGKIPLVIVEAQVGQYLEEDDIIRLNDDYNRMLNV